MGLATVLVGSFLYVFVRTLWDFEGSFASQIDRAGYPKTDITTGKVAGWGKWTEKAYDARVQVGTCLLHLQRTQFDGGYKLIAVNGRPVKLDDSPTKDEAIKFLAGQDIKCAGK